MVVFSYPHSISGVYLLRYAYDPLGMLTTVDYPSSQADLSYAYSALGWRTAMTDSDDNANRLAGVSGTGWDK